MKINFTKSLMTLLVVAFATTMYAQPANLVYLWGGPNSTGQEYKNSTFEGGINDWTTEGIECDVPDSVHNAIWTWSDADTLKGAYFGARKVVTPTTANGYMSFDSDFLDNAGVSGDDNVGTGLAPAPQISGLTSPALDFTGHPGVSIVFYEAYRNYQARTVIQVSNDGGATWVDHAVSMNDALSVNQGLHSELVFVNIDISATAGNQSDVRVRFLWTRPLSTDSKDGYY